MRTTRTPPSRCPRCDAPLTGASDMEGSARPRPGDVSVCLYCAALLKYTAQRTLRALTAAEVRALAVDEPDVLAQLRRYAAAARNFRQGTRGTSRPQ
jgi:hypothetical protein